MTARGTWTERVAGIDPAPTTIFPNYSGGGTFARFGAIIRRSSGHTTPTLEAGPLRVDTRRMITTVNGAPVRCRCSNSGPRARVIHNKGRPVSQFELGETFMAPTRSQAPTRLKC